MEKAELWWTQNSARLVPDGTTGMHLFFLGAMLLVLW